jgi:hydrogenase maturation protein HypF
MLAYTPLHHLLLRDAGIPLVMTSGNNSDEPIAYKDEEAFEQLGEISDYFLVHDREIHMRTDDSVVRVAGEGPYPIRRSRGYAPAPLRVAESFGKHVLACGGELKNTFCVAKDRHAFVSHHIGDLENYETLRSFREGIEHFCRLFDVQPELVAYDLHPEYLSTKYARELEEAGLPAVGIQHHHAHVASCLADNERPADERVIGVALDGTGYGTDGVVWGGEFFEGSVADGFERRAHLEYMPLPGGSAAIRQPWRMAVAQLVGLYGLEETLKLPLPVIKRTGERDVRLVARLVERGLNTPSTSSAGRLFDAVSALAGLPGTRRTTYEGQAAIELELSADGPADGIYPFRLLPEGDGWIVETRATVAAVVEALLDGRLAAEVSARFHRTMAEMVVAICERLREGNGTDAVALSGGTFQNLLLLDQVVQLLEEKGFTVYRHLRVPANDGGLALGQAVLADKFFREKEA